MLDFTVSTAFAPPAQIAWHGVSKRTLAAAGLDVGA